MHTLLRLAELILDIVPKTPPPVFTSSFRALVAMSAFGQHLCELG